MMPFILISANHRMTKQTVVCRQNTNQVLKVSLPLLIIIFNYRPKEYLAASDKEEDYGSGADCQKQNDIAFQNSVSA